MIRRIVALASLQFNGPGLFDAPKDRRIHLVRMTVSGGTPGDTLCGIDRFAPAMPGWSVGGGVSGPGVDARPCGDCMGVADVNYPGAPVWSSPFADLFPSRAKAPWSVSALPVIATENGEAA